VNLRLGFLDLESRFIFFRVPRGRPGLFTLTFPVKVGPGGGDLVGSGLGKDRGCVVDPLRVQRRLLSHSVSACGGARSGGSVRCRTKTISVIRLGLVLFPWGQARGGIVSSTWRTLKQR
jgi:hypothetical protein